MYLPAQHNEMQTIHGYVVQELEALRASAHGLTDEQARLTPCRSELSIGGILKHVTHVFAKDVAAAVGPGAPADPLEQFYASFVMRDDETLADVLARFDAMVEGVDAMFADGGDPDELVTQPPAPWYGITTESTVRRRYQLMHIVQELSRHAGHADIIREQIDGTNAASLLLVVLAKPGNVFVQPWTPSDASAN